MKTDEATTELDLYISFGTNAPPSETYREQSDTGIEFHTVTKTVYEGY